VCDRIGPVVGRRVVKQSLKRYFVGRDYVNQMLLDVSQVVPSRNVPETDRTVAGCPPRRKDRMGWDGFRRRRGTGACDRTAPTASPTGASGGIKRRQTRGIRSADVWRFRLETVVAGDHVTAGIDSLNT